MKCGRQEGRCTLSRPEKNAQQPFTDSTASSHFYPGIPGLRSSMGRVSLSTTPCADLTDVTLADEYTNSIPTDNANRTIQGNVAMKVAQSGGPLCKQWELSSPKLSKFVKTAVLTLGMDILTMTMAKLCS